jgi:2',3'-cyclic-nucleotide 3'-phosphodiesterase
VAGVSLWLIPSNEDALKLKGIMRARADKPHSSLSYPEFTPHITLAYFPSSIEPPLSRLQEVATAAPSGSVSVEFKSIEIGDHFFRSVYLAIKLSPALSALHEHLHTKLALEPHTPAFPHSSLCYIDDEDAKNGERDEFLRELETSGRVKRDEDGVGLKYGETGTEDWLRGFQGTEIWIIGNAEGLVDEWSILDKVSLVTGDGH